MYDVLRPGAGVEHLAAVLVRNARGRPGVQPRAACISIDYGRGLRFTTKRRIST